jgi:hypothetical protein
MRAFLSLLINERRSRCSLSLLLPSLSSHPRLFLFRLETNTNKQTNKQTKQLVLQGEGAEAKAASTITDKAPPPETVGALGRLPTVIQATTTTTHVVLRPPLAVGEEEQGSTGARSSSISWSSRRVGKVLESCRGRTRTRKMFFAPVLDGDAAAAFPGEKGQEEEKAIMTSEQAVAAVVAQASSAPSQDGLVWLEGAYGEAALEALPWRQRVFRLRDLALEGARIKDVRLVCLKKKQMGGAAKQQQEQQPLPLPYCLFLGELSLGHVRRPTPPASTSTTRPTPSSLPPRPSSLLLNPFNGSSTISCRALALRLAHWEPGSRRLSGQLVWEWGWSEGAEGKEEEPADSIVAHTDILLFASSAKGPPLWVGRAFTPAFAISIALPAEGAEGCVSEGVRVVLQPRDRLGSVLPLCACPSLKVVLQEAGPAAAES